jgi:predicted RNA-binding Zn-ribbon protein involved in translation (DUF1610 family)
LSADAQKHFAAIEKDDVDSVVSLGIDQMSRVGRDTTSLTTGRTISAVPDPIQDVIICAYCFEFMHVKDNGAWFLCPDCGHVTLPCALLYLCNCEKLPSIVLGQKSNSCNAVLGHYQGILEDNVFKVL